METKEGVVTLAGRLDVGEGEQADRARDGTIQEAVATAREAVEAGDAWRAVEALWASPVLDGVVRRVWRHWPWLPDDDVDRA
jgi:hypothetical protein